MHWLRRIGRSNFFVMQVDIEEQVEAKIKTLPTLKEKVQAIAINGYLIEKRRLDK